MPRIKYAISEQQHQAHLVLIRPWSHRWLCFVYSLLRVGWLLGSKKLKDGTKKRKLGRNPRVPFTQHQVSLLEQKFRRTHYLSSIDVAELSSALNLTENRVTCLYLHDIWTSLTLWVVKQVIYEWSQCFATLFFYFLNVWWQCGIWARAAMCCAEYMIGWRRCALLTFRVSTVDGFISWVSWPSIGLLYTLQRSLINQHVALCSTCSYIAICIRPMFANVVRKTPTISTQRYSKK